MECCKGAVISPGIRAFSLIYISLNTPVMYIINPTSSDSGGKT
jgi:hypothetical protein